MHHSSIWRLAAAMLLALATCHARANIDIDEVTPSETGSDVSAASAIPMAAAVRTRLADASRLLAAGDFESAERVLGEAAEHAKQPSEREAVERALAQIDFRRGRYTQAIDRHRALLNQASERGDLSGVAQAELDIGLLERRQGALNEAIGGFERALSLFRQLGDRDGIAAVLTHIGLIRLNQGEYSTALESLRESQRLQAEGAKAELDRTLHYLGLLYAGLREYETSRKFLEQGLAEARRQADAAREAPLLGSMAKISNLRGTYSEALGLARDSLSLVERLDSPPGRAYARLEEGRALLGLNRLDEARTALEAGAAIAERIEQHGTLADFRALLAEIARRQGREEDALALWELALPMYQRGHDQPQLLTSYRAMMPVLRERGMHDRALDIAEESLRLQEQISGLNMNRRLAVLESQHRTEAAEREIEILKRDNEIKALRLRDEETRQWRGLLVIATLGLAALLLAWRYAESRRFARRLSRTNSELVSSREDLSQAHRELEKRADLLARAASTDPLTGVANRREFTQRLAQQFDDAQTRRTPLTMLVVDVDHFKQFNDTYGHAVGDEVLCSIARTLQSSVRSGTLIARWGGEEFVILLPGAEVAVGARLAERVREAVGAIRRDGLDKVTVSIGVAGTEGRELKRPEDLFDEADAALYHAKGSGRDQVVLASSVTGSWTTMPGPNRTH
ncbi:MAG: diguanylate cyclase [Xanthomonadales bacterium]|nr:diguanylate cyclase [Xanthomonadales bacterium]